MTAPPLLTPIAALRTLVDALTPPLTDDELHTALEAAQRTLDAYEPTDWTPDQIRALRQRRGWTQKQLAAALGAEVDTVRNWEHGLRKPNETNHERLDKVNERERAR